jgi:5-methylcytosine-specific restriction endonuclease McrA
MNSEKGRISVEKYRKSEKFRKVNRLKQNLRKARLNSLSIIDDVNQEYLNWALMRCEYTWLGDCDGPIQLDHIVPITDKNSEHSESNLIGVCRKHNIQKSNNSLLMFLNRRTL